MSRLVYRYDKARGLVKGLWVKHKNDFNHRPEQVHDPEIKFNIFNRGIFETFTALALSCAVLLYCIVRVLLYGRSSNICNIII